MTMKRIIDFLNILALCAAFGLLAACGGKSGLDPDPEPEPEPVEENRTSDLPYCVLSELDGDILELIYSRFTGEEGLLRGGEGGFCEREGCQGR